MQKLRFWKKASAMAISFAMAFSLFIGFSVESVKAANSNLTVDEDVSNDDVTIYWDYDDPNGDDFDYVVVTIKQESGGNDTQEEEDTDYDSSMDFDNLDDGDWSYTVAAYDDNDERIGRQTGTFEIGNGGSNPGNGQIGKPSVSSANDETPDFTADANLDYDDYYDYGFAFSTSSSSSKNSISALIDDREYIDASYNGDEIYANNVDLTDYFEDDEEVYYLWAIAFNDEDDFVSSSSSLKYNHEAGKPTVTTDSATTSGASLGHVYATGRISNVGSSNITEYGFVYSTSVSEPTIGARNCDEVEVGGSANRNSSFSEEFAPSVSSSSSGSQRLYVRAYATNKQGTGYGTTRTVNNVSANQFNVALNKLTPSTGTSVTADIAISGITASQVYEWGVVWSSSSSSPTRASGTSYAEADRGKTSASLDMSNLSPNTRYYVRAYGRTSGGNYVYSSTQQVTTQLSMGVSVSNVAEVTFNTATFTGSLDAEGNNNQVSEKGFVYSRSNNMPTINDSSAKHGNTQPGNFSVDVEYLSADTQYYVRAYVKSTSGQYYYSENAQNFRTSRNNIRLDIYYRDPSGANVGSESLELNGSSFITSNSLRNIPSGYALQDPNWRFSVSVSQELPIYVVPVGGQVQQPTQQIPQQQQPSTPQTAQPFGPEGVYMTGVGSYMFGPANNGLVIDVAAMLYSVLANPTMSYSSPIYFPDVDYSNPTTANIVNFVSSQGFMVGNDMGLFRPNATITRAEIAVILCEIGNLEATYTGQLPIPARFPDTVTNAMNGYITLAADNGAFSGYEDGTFRPTNNVTKAELAVIFANMFDRSLAPLGNVDFIDVPRDNQQWSWAYPYIMNAAVPRP